MTFDERVPLGRLLKRPPRYGINAAAVPLAPDVPTYIRITDIDEFGRFTPNPKVGVAHPNAASYRLSSGELVFARTGASVGKSYLYDSRDGDLVYAGFLINIAPDPKLLNPKFLALYAQTKEYWDWIARTSVRSGQPGVNGREYATLPVLLPDILTQNAIVGALTDVDDLIRVLEALITKKRAMKRGIMQQLLTGRTRLPGFSARWKTFRLVDVISIRNGQVDPRRPEYRDLPLIAPDHVESATGRLLEVKTAKAQGAISGKYLVAPGDIIYSKIRPYLQKAVRIDFPALCSADMYPLTPKAGTDGAFVLHLLLSEHFTNFATSVSARSGIPKVNRAELAEFSLPVPDFSEQQAISDALNQADDQILALANLLDKIRALKQGMMQQLLTGRTRLPSPEAA